jgi:hypothetical protein
MGVFSSETEGSNNAGKFIDLSSSSSFTGNLINSPKAGSEY